MGLNINPSSIAAPSNDFAPLPDGKYPVRVLEAVEEARTAQNGNEYEQVKFTFEVCCGDNKGRRVWRNAIFAHPNEKAGEIGLSFLRSLFDALGCDGNITTDTLLGSGKCVEAVVRTQKGTNGYPDRQEVAFINRLKEQPCDNGGCDASAAPAVDAGDDIF